MNDPFLTAILLSLLGGLFTTVGSVIALSMKRPNPNTMSFMLGFSGGVMLLLSFIELLQESIEKIGFIPAFAGFFAGIVIMLLIDNFIPHDYMTEHHRTRRWSEDSTSLMRTGLFVALGVGIHNFPEGMVVFTGTMEDVTLGVAITIAIALHNIPEGLSVSVPIYAATGDRRKAFWWSFLSGIAEPIGALLAAFFLLPVLNESIMGLMLAAVAGIMVFISLDELIPSAKAYNGTGHVSIAGITAGMMVMAFSLWMLE
jgi:ZIP family zinc transporter